MRYSNNKTSRGQGMTEYIIIVALIAVAAITAYSFFGKTVRQQLSGVAIELSGKDAGTMQTASQTSAKTAGKEGDKKMGSYNNGQN